MNRLQITKEAQTKNGKSRQFSAIYMASIRADSLWDGGRTDTGKVERPVYLAVAGTDVALRPFLANLRLGRRAEMLTAKRRSWNDGNAVQLLKSVRYDAVTQRHGDLTVIQLMHPDVWPVEPGMVDPHVVAFLSVTPEWWHARQSALLAADRELAGRVLGHAARAGLHAVRPGDPLTDEELLDLLPDAARFAQYLDRRTRRPIPNDPAFYLQLLLNALAGGGASVSEAHEAGWASRLSWAYHRRFAGFNEFNTAVVGLRPGVIFSLAVEAADAFLAAQVRLYTEASHG